jgi:hypothetical protein
MTYRIQLFRDDLRTGDIPSDGLLADTRQDTMDAIDLFKADYALILDDAGQVVERINAVPPKGRKSSAAQTKASGEAAANLGDKITRAPKTSDDKTSGKKTSGKKTGKTR